MTDVTHPRMALGGERPVTTGLLKGLGAFSVLVLASLALAGCGGGDDGEKKKK